MSWNAPLTILQTVAARGMHGWGVAKQIQEALVTVCDEVGDAGELGFGDAKGGTGLAEQVSRGKRCGGVRRLREMGACDEKERRRGGCGESGRS